MSAYHYKAMDEEGRTRRGRIEAANPDELHGRLEKMGLDLISWRQVTQKSSSWARSAISRRDLIDFCFQLEQLLASGVTLLDGLSDLQTTAENQAMRELIAALLTSIQEGSNFSSALAAYPKVFDEIFVSLVRAGEESGQLPAIFRSLGENLKWEDELIARAKKAVTYPAVVTVVVSGAVTMLMVFLVPQLVEFIKNMGGELPLHTKLLLATSNFFVGYWYLILGLPVALIFAVKALTAASPAARLLVDTWKLKLPLLGEVLLKIILARFCKIFALMYSSGISLLQIMETSERTVGNRAVALALNDARRQISEGENLSQSLTDSAIFPPLVLRMVAIGERTGELDKSMLNAAYYFDRDVNELIGKLEASMEPALTVILGIILGWIMLSVLGPIYDLISTIG